MKERIGIFMLGILFFGMGLSVGGGWAAKQYEKKMAEHANLHVQEIDSCGDAYKSLAACRSVLQRAILHQDGCTSAFNECLGDLSDCNARLRKESDL